MNPKTIVTVSLITMGIAAVAMFILIGFINFLAFESSVHNGWKITIALLSLVSLAGFSIKWSNC